jgi:hypothetical protein
MRPLLSFSLLVVLSVLSVSPAFSQDVRVNYMPHPDFRKYRSYSWGLIEGSVPNQIVDAEIKQALEGQLAGFLGIDDPKADLRVSRSAYPTHLGRKRQKSSSRVRRKMSTSTLVEVPMASS